MKKKILFVLLICVSVAVFAQNYEVLKRDYLGNMDSTDFVIECGNDVGFSNGLRQIYGTQLRNFKMIRSPDDEDSRMLRWVLDNTLPKSGVSFGDVYTVAVRRSRTINYEDGWYIFWRNNGGRYWDYFLYYYSVNQ